MDPEGDYCKIREGLPFLFISSNRLFIVYGQHVGCSSISDVSVASSTSLPIHPPSLGFFNPRRYSHFNILVCMLTYIIELYSNPRIHLLPKLYPLLPLEPTPPPSVTDPTAGLSP